MADYSKSPLDVLHTNLARGYVGMHIEQGVPVLDRDLNLLHDIISSTVRSVIGAYIGNGVAAGRDGFRISAVPANNDFTIGAGPAGKGTCLVDGIEATIDTPIAYSSQSAVAPLTTPTVAQPDPRTDTVYLDVCFEEVDGAVDPDLLNTDDIGIQTSVRQKVAWRVRVSESIPPGAPAPGHHFYPLAAIVRPRGVAQINAAMITDLRNQDITVTDMERRLRVLEQIVMIPQFNASPGQFSPKLGTAGTTVTLYGKNFNIGTVVVRFGTIAAALAAAPTPTEITAIVPGGVSGPVKVSVETSGGTAVSVDNFTVLGGGGSGDPPAFAAAPGEFSPKVGSISSSVTLFGSHFNEPGLIVKFGAVIASVSSFTASQINTSVPGGVAGAIKISVTTNFGTATSVDSFTVL